MVRCSLKWAIRIGNNDRILSNNRCLPCWIILGIVNDNRKLVVVIKQVSSRGSTKKRQLLRRTI